MPTTEQSAQKIAKLFTSGICKVELEPEEVTNWHDTGNLLLKMGLAHVNMSGTSSGTIAPYAIDATHRRNPFKVLSRFLKRVGSGAED